LTLINLANKHMQMNEIELLC